VSGRRLLAAATLVVATACSSTSSPSSHGASPATGCRPIVAKLVDLTQRYLDGVAADTQLTGLATTPPSQSPSPSPSPSASTVTEQEYTAAITAARQNLAAAGCSQAVFSEALQAGLGTVRPHGAVATAVLAQLRAESSGSVPTAAVSRTATPRDDLSSILAALPAGSTLTLTAGTYRLPDTLVLLRPVTVRGAGPGATVLTSQAGDAAVLVLTDQRVMVSGLAVRRIGTAAGSVIVTGPTAALTLRHVAASGARVDPKGTSGGVGVLLTASGATTGGPGVSFTAVDSTFSDNDAAGVAAGGTHRVSISASTFAHNRQCGVCYLGSSSGTVGTSTFTGDAVGVVVSSAGAVVVKGNHFQGGDVGIQVVAQARPTITGNVISGTARAAMVFVDTSSGTVDGNNCSGDRSGIAVARSAYPYVKTNACRVTLG
jgi:nitrous oxidase accessory protein NosD